MWFKILKHNVLHGEKSMTQEFMYWDNGKKLPYPNYRMQDFDEYCRRYGTNYHFVKDCLKCGIRKIEIPVGDTESEWFYEMTPEISDYELGKCCLERKLYPQLDIYMKG